MKVIKRQLVRKNAVCIHEMNISSEVFMQITHAICLQCCIHADDSNWVMEGNVFDKVDNTLNIQVQNAMPGAY